MIQTKTYAVIALLTVFSAGCHREPGGGFNAASVSNLKVLGYCMNQYTQDHNNLFPRMRHWADVKDALRPYEDKDRVFVQPETGRPYAVNAWLSGKNLGAIPKPGQIILFYEDQAAVNRTRGIVVIDGHARRILETQWPQYKKLSHIP